MLFPLYYSSGGTMVGKRALQLPGIKCKVNCFGDVGPAWPPDVWFTIEMVSSVRHRSAPAGLRPHQGLYKLFGGGILASVILLAAWRSCSGDPACIGYYSVSHCRNKCTSKTIGKTTSEILLSLKFPLGKLDLAKFKAFFFSHDACSQFLNSKLISR